MIVGTNRQHIIQQGITSFQIIDFRIKDAAMKDDVQHPPRVFDRFDRIGINFLKDLRHIKLGLCPFLFSGIHQTDPRIR